MSAFRKRAKLVSDPSPCSASFGKTIFPTTKTVLPKGSRKPVTYVEMKELDVSDVASQLDLPLDEDYKLETMLKAGIVPQEVPVTGLLDSADPTDLANQGVGDSILSRLDESLPHSEPAPVVSEPAPSLQSTE